jgi:hypothetical protein
MRGIIQTAIGWAAMGEAKLYVIPGSHSSRSAMKERKGRTPPVFPAEWLAGVRS